MNRLPAKGFTLVELLVVIGLFALISVMAYGGLNATLKSRRAVEISLQRTAELQKAYQRLRNDFQQVRNRPVRDGYGDAQPALLGLSLPRVEFTHGGWRNPAGVARPGLERVSYRLKDGALVRESFRVLDQAQDSQAVSLVLLSKVNELRLRYLDMTSEWQDTWPPLSATGNAPGPDAPAPRAVEITLVTAAEGQLQFIFRTGLDLLPPGFVRGEQSSSGTGAATGPEGTPATPVPPPTDGGQPVVVEP